MRKGFGLIMAIAFIVLVATIGALALSFSTQTSKQTGDVYLRTQAELLAISAAEYAILALSAHNIASDNCINKINLSHNNLFNIDITLQYIGNGLTSSGCNTLDDDIFTADSNVTILMDVIVESNGTEEPVRIHRRTLQKL